jgi:hypothetical protein
MNIRTARLFNLKSQGPMSVLTWKEHTVNDAQVNTKFQENRQKS